MRLDEADPVAAWRRHIEKLTARAEVLNAHAFDRVRYRGPGTDVTIGLAEESTWCGGSMRSQDDVEFVPNMPTEEVFVSPDWRRAEGVVRTTAPFFLQTMGALVEDLRLELRDGTITGVQAGRGEAEVRQQFDAIPRSRHLGEVAIVDRDSRVAATGLVYRDMLFDENVGSHIAWGFGFPTAFRGMVDRSPDERVECRAEPGGDARRRRGGKSRRADRRHPRRRFGGRCHPRRRVRAGGVNSGGRRCRTTS